MEEKNIKDIAELKVRQYFDHFLENIYPKLMLEHHNGCKHGKLLNKFKWVGVGVVATLVLLAPTVGRDLVNIIIKFMG